MVLLDQLVLFLSVYAKYYFIGVPITAAIYGWWIENREFSSWDLVTHAFLWPVFLPFNLLHMTRRWWNTNFG